MSHSPKTPPDPNSWRLRLWRLAQRCLAYYLGVVLVLSLIQRSLMYVPTNVPSLPVAKARLPMGNGEDITYQTDDGLQLHGWHFLPAGKTGVDQAAFDRQLTEGSEFVVLFFPGNGGNRLHRAADFELLTKLGAHVVAFDYRGYGENPGSPSEAKFAADAHAAWKYVTETRHVSANRVLIYGESLGGGVATRLAADLCQAKTPPAGLILCSTFSSMVDAASYHYPWLPVRAILKDRYQSDQRIKHMTAPLLMLHGQRDRIVPYVQGRKLFDAAPAKSDTDIAKTFVDLPRADHNDILLTEETRYREGLRVFLRGLRR